MRVAEKKKIGRVKQDNGVILLVVRQEKQMRIEVGYGLEGTLMDAQATRVIRDVMRPRFRENDYYVGIAQGV